MILRKAQGVTLTEIRLHGNGGIVDRAYHVATLRTPETWNCTSLAEADALFLDEVGKSENDPLVQRRLTR
ncbi:MAG: hypothetical protein EBU34_09850 [Alphaproteobacteria bacterium]|nr:hypothetical protein [Alphaproteobacteria bacterium]